MNDWQLVWYKHTRPTQRFVDVQSESNPLIVACFNFQSCTHFKMINQFAWLLLKGCDSVYLADCVVIAIHKSQISRFHSKYYIALRIAFVRQIILQLTISKLWISMFINYCLLNNKVFFFVKIQYLRVNMRNLIVYNDQSARWQNANKWNQYENLTVKCDATEILYLCKRTMNKHRERADASVFRGGSNGSFKCWDILIMKSVDKFF